MEQNVVPANVYTYLSRVAPRHLTEVYAKNVFEHLSNAGEFLKLCKSALRLDGKLTVITDNALWLPFYVPLPKSWNSFRLDGLWSVAAHTASYPRNTPHFSIYTKSHLLNLAKEYGFHDAKVEYGFFPEKWSPGLGLLHKFPLFPRLKATMFK